MKAGMRRWITGTTAILVAVFGAGVQERGTAAAQESAPAPGIVVRADRIEAQGLLPSLATGSDGGLVIRLQIRRATAYGLRLIRNQSETQSDFSWGMRIDSPGPVVLDDLVADVTALGLRGIGLKLDVSIPQLALQDVFLRCSRLAAGHVSMPSMNLHTDKRIEDSGTAPLIDLRSLTLINGQGVADLINGLLSGDQSEAAGKTEGEARSEPQGDGGKKAESPGNAAAGTAGATSGGAAARSGYGENREQRSASSSRSGPAGDGSGDSTGQRSGMQIFPVNEMPRELMIPFSPGSGPSYGTMYGSGPTGSTQGRRERSAEGNSAPPPLDLAGLLKPLLGGGR